MPAFSKKNANGNNNWGRIRDAEVAGSNPVSAIDLTCFVVIGLVPY